MTDPIDFAAMYAMHDVLRRELAQLDAIVTRGDIDARSVIATAVGWQLFTEALHVHHTAEDDALWPALREADFDTPEDQALLEAMEAEHAAVDPLIGAIDAVLADPHADPGLLGDLAGSLAAGLAGHLKHEEDAALPLIQRVITPEQWLHFGQVHAQRIGPDAPQLLAWLLDGADDPTTAQLLAPLPAHARAAYTTQWQPAYTALDRWNSAPHTDTSTPTAGAARKGRRTGRNHVPTTPRTPERNARQFRGRRGDSRAVSAERSDDAAASVRPQPPETRKPAGAAAPGG